MWQTPLIPARITLDCDAWSFSSTRLGILQGTSPWSRPCSIWPLGSCALDKILNIQESQKVPSKRLEGPSCFVG